MVTKDNAGKILSRIDNIPLYLHAYAYHLNMRLERILPNDLLTIADSLHLKGVKIHVLDGERYSLSNMNDAQLAGFAEEGANKQVISSQADSLIKISRIWADFFPANTSNQPI